MRVLTQDRSHIIKLPKDIWISKVDTTGRYLIICTSKIAPYLGVYKDDAAAREALQELYQSIAERKDIHEMS